MAWVKFDDAFYRHEKRWELDLEAIGLLVLMLCYANDKLTDGFVPVAYVKSNLPKRGTVQTLVDAGFLDEVDGGYQIHDYLDYQPSKDKVLQLRSARAAAGKRGAAKRWGSTSNGVAIAIAAVMAFAITSGSKTYGPQLGNLDAPYPVGVRDVSILEGSPSSASSTSERNAAAQRRTGTESGGLR